jgi:hypothetical protein
MLKAKFLKMGKGGALAIYEVQGTSTELADFVANNFKNSPKGPVFKSSPDGEAILDSNGNKTPLYFTSYPLPGKNMLHPLYQVQAGDNKGSYTLDKSEIQFDALVAKSMGSNLGDQIANQMAQKYTTSAPITQSLSALVDDDEDEDSEEEPESASAAVADLTQLTVKAEAKTGK